MLAIDEISVRVDADDLSDADRVALGLGVGDPNLRFARRLTKTEPLPDGFVRRLTAAQREELAAGYYVQVARKIVAGR